MFKTSSSIFRVAFVYKNSRRFQSSMKYPGLSGFGPFGAFWDLYGPCRALLHFGSQAYFWASVYSKAKILTILLFSLIHQRNLVPSVKQVWRSSSQHVRLFNDSAEPQNVQKLGRAGGASPTIRLWSDQKSCHLRSKSYLFRVLVGPITVRLSFFSNGRTNFALLPPPLLGTQC